MMRKKQSWVRVHSPCIKCSKGFSTCLSAELSQQLQETQEEATPREAPEAHQERVHRLSQLTEETKENVDSLNEATR